MFAPDALGASVPGGPVAIGKPGKAGVAVEAPTPVPVGAVVVAVVDVVAGGLAPAIFPPFTRCRVWPSSTL